MYRVLCKFEPDYKNPLTGRPGLWRVCYSLDCPKDTYPWIGKLLNRMAIPSSKPYKPGSIIRPHKELNKILEARKTQA